MIQKVRFLWRNNEQEKREIPSGFGHSSRVVRFMCGENILDLPNSASAGKKTQSVLK